MNPWSHLPPWLALLVDVLAAYRLTRLVTTDVLTQGLRDRVIVWSYHRAGRDLDPSKGPVQPTVEADMDEDPATVPKPAVLVVCRWCCGAWIAAGVVAARGLVPAVWAPVAWGLVAASGAALVAGAERD